MALPLAPDDIVRIVSLARDGMPRNEIARTLAVSPAAVSKHTAAAGITFDRSATEAATKAAAIDSAALRLQLANDLIADLAEARKRLRSRTAASMSEEARRAQGLAALSRSFADVTRAAPLEKKDSTVEEVRGALLDFAVGLRGLYGEDDRYGQVSADGGASEVGDAEAASAGGSASV
jgi:predicted transcriptional regulator